MYRIVITLVFFAVAQVVCGQSLRELQEQKRSADKELINMNEQLNSTKKDKNSTIRQVNLVHSMILKRKKIIENIDNQVALLTKSITVKSDTVVKLRSDITTLKEEYAKTLRQAYKLRSTTSAIAFVLASADLQQAVMRMKYLRSYSDFRVQQAASIENKQTVLKGEIVDLNSKKRNLELLVGEKNKEVAKLAADEKTYESMLVQLKSKEKDLLNEIQKKRLLSERLTKEINYLIAEEARKAAEAAKRRAAEEAAKARAAGEKRTEKPSRTPTKELPFTPEDRIIAGKFESNKGRLPWPLRQGEIVEGFGSHEHPLLKGIIVKNDGVDIASVGGSDVMAVFDGEVSKIFTLPGANISVLIRHGYYITVYSNLSRVNVKEGQNVKAKQSIGVLASSEAGASRPTLKFQIRKETVPLNPASWLVK